MHYEGMKYENWERLPDLEINVNDITYKLTSVYRWKTGAYHRYAATVYPSPIPFGKPSLEIRREIFATDADAWNVSSISIVKGHEFGVAFGRAINKNFTGEW